MIFHSAPLNRHPSPALVVSVDTEEEGLWGGAFRRTGNTVENIQGIPRFQALCEEYGVRPTYLVDTPVVEDVRAVDTLKDIHDRGGCEIGAHLHPWCAPPLSEEPSARNSFMCNLTERLQRDKLVGLTERIAERFGCRPTSFRAGRYGLDGVGARLLGELGYTVDSSVIPYSDYSSEGGPDFRDAPFTPYFINGGDDLCSPSGSGTLLEVPVSVGFNRANFARANRIRETAARRPLRQLHAVGLLDRLGLVQRIKFSPEQADERRLCRLVDVYLANEAPCLVMLLHSSSLVVGHSPYVPNYKALERFYHSLRIAFEHCTGQKQMRCATLTEYGQEAALSHV